MKIDLPNHTASQLCSDDDSDQHSLRSRKRAATRLTIRREAIALGLAHGYENVTVEMICAASTVSPRTFFNYFGSKEGAYISAHKPLPTAQQHRDFVEGAGPSVFRELFELICGTFLAAETDLELFQGRHRLIYQTPELLNREKSRISEMEEIFAGYVLERFQHEGRSTTDTPDLEDEAHMVVALASGALRFALQKWVAGNFTSTRETLMRTTSALIQRVTTVAPVVSALLINKAIFLISAVKILVIHQLATVNLV